VRRRRRFRSWRAPVAAAGALTAVAVLAVTVVPGSPASSSDAVVTLPPPPPTVSAPVADDDAPTRTAESAEVDSLEPVPPETTTPESTTPSASTTPSTSPTSTTTTVAQLVVLDRPLRVLVTGDSMALHMSDALIAHATEVPDELLVGSAAFPGCGLTAGADGRMHEFTDVDGSRDLIDLSGCLLQWQTVPQRVVDEAVDVVVVQIGAWDAVDVHLPDGRVVSAGDDAGLALLRDAYRDFTSAVVDAGARVLWVCPADAHLGWGEVDDPVNEPARWDAIRSVIDELSVEFGVARVDLGAWFAAQGLEGPDGRPDGIHLGPGLNERFVLEAVDPALAALAGRT
jgi:hypothetical protein